jgi:aminoglycoside phosphotransferase family enzyme
MAPEHDIGLEAKVAFLRQPWSYPESSYRVEAIETHMSWVFLTDGFAWKLKKPVHHDLLDFSTAATRHRYCEEEIRLNRRLAASAYLSVVALGVGDDGHLQLDGGATVDWLVKMRRLPTEGMLDYALRHGQAGPHEAAAIADRLSRFYRSGAPVSLDPAEYRDRFRRDIELNRQELSTPAFGLPVEDVGRICAAQRVFLERRAELFDERAAAGRIVEGHGDLRPEHVCMQPELVIIDCLEFSRDLRIVDTIDEVGFLALECERLGAPEFGAMLLRSYNEYSGDRPHAALAHFYQSYRAVLRARIAIRHLNEEKFRYSAEWRRRANDYFRLAEHHLACC